MQSHTVYSNVSKGILAKSKDLIAAFGTDDQSKICLEVCRTLFEDIFGLPVSYYYIDFFPVDHPGDVLIHTLEMCWLIYVHLTDIKERRASGCWEREGIYFVKSVQGYCNHCYAKDI